MILRKTQYFMPIKHEIPLWL